MEDDFALKALLAAHGWTLKTAVCMAAFSLFHWPCSTTLLTIKKETGSLRWTATAFLLPTVIGIVVCILISSVWMQETSDAACCPGSPVCGNVLPGDGRAPDLRLARRARLH